MNQTTKSKNNLLLWLLVLAIIGGGIVANAYYGEVAGAIRAAVGIVVGAIVLVVAGQTTQGQTAWTFVKGSRMELRKVVWPTRQETVQTTMVVVAMVLVTAIILWGVDTVFYWAVSWLTGQRG